MELTGFLAAIVLAAFLSVVIRRQNPEQALAVTLVAGILLLVAVLQRAMPLFRNVQDMLSQSGLSEEYLHIVFKALGVCLLTQLAADVCRDVGEQALANKAEFAGKVSLLLLALPLFEKIGSIALSLMEQKG